MTKPKKPEVQPPPADSDEMRRFDAVVSGVWGWHHLKAQKWHRPDCCEVWLFGSLSTFDYNELTRLVVLAHDNRIRAEVRQNRGLSVLLTLRKEKAENFTLVHCHPTLERHTKAIRDYQQGDTDAYEVMYREMKTDGEA